ncbi:hypothetical protein HOLleu_42703 [Holothuria leucospilota]|uniref:Uncharacterized protein n=1 Tax=Holothuria leucospilota TaxID=206669 RepID=A0A9Q0YCF7_HOLLE|nr:hypothetical protein HOLleu_42703 [Holothuria leucospilota]
MRKGNFLHNKLVIASQCGEIIPVRRPIEKVSPEDYGPCPTCLGYFLREELRRHATQSCLGGDGGRPSKADLKMESEIMQGLYAPHLKDVLPIIEKMRQDKITLVAKKDKLVMQLGENLARRCCGMDSQKCRHYVSQKMRESARLLMNFRNIANDSADFNELIHPSNFDVVIQAVQVTAGEPEVDNTDVDGVQHPSEINTVIEEMKSKVVEERSSLYRRGQHLALAHLTFFNKRRPGEVEQLQLTTFTNEPDYRKEDIDEIQDTLTSLEKQLCADIQLVFVRGKRGRKVPIIIMPSCFELMEILVETRLEAGIPKKNNYFFGRYNALTPLRACDSLRLLTEEANIENAELIKSTKL